MVVWMAASATSSILKGDTVNVTDIPVHLLMSSPHALTLVLAMSQRHR
jgi:hypothetical protein